MPRTVPAIPSGMPVTASSIWSLSSGKTRKAVTRQEQPIQRTSWSVACCRRRMTSWSSLSMLCGEMISSPSDRRSRRPCGRMADTATIESRSCPETPFFPTRPRGRPATISQRSHTHWVSLGWQPPMRRQWTSIGSPIWMERPRPLPST